MGYGGKVVEQEQARALRADAWTLQDIGTELGVAKSSVSLWVRDVEFEPQPRRTSRRRSPNVIQRRKQAEIDELLAEGRARIDRLGEQEFLVVGPALCAGEGSKRSGALGFADSDPRMIVLFCAWLATLLPDRRGSATGAALPAPGARSRRSDRALVRVDGHSARTVR